MTTAALILAAVTAGEPAQLCTLCHPDVRVTFESSVHSSEEVTCVSCHGGDSSAVTVEDAHRGRFRGNIPRRDVPVLCASCHSDAKRMSPYNLPTDQQALYLTSQHGRALIAGDERVAVCTDCHGVHDVLRTADLRSRVHPANIPQTCGVCHSNSEMMSAYGMKNDPYADFVASRHGEALLRESNSSSPDCSRCHGSHGAAPPGVGDIHKVCGHCHGTVRAHFLDGPHRQAMDRAGLPECASCHDHHRIMKADVSLLDSACIKCHESDSEEVELALQMKTLFITAANDLETARGFVARAEAIPLYVADYRARLEVANTSLLESLPAMHAVDIERVAQLTGRARSIGHEVESEVLGKLEGRRWRRVGLMVFWFYVVVTVAILVRFRRQAAREVAS